MIPGSDPSSFSPFCLSVFLFFFFPSFLSLFLFLLSFVFFQLSKQSSSLILSSLPGFLLKISFCFFLTPKTLLSNSPRLFFFFVSFKKSFLLFFVFSPSVFIGARREGHLTPTMAQGKVATLPMSWHMIGWLGMVALIMAGYEMWLVSGEGEQEKIFKIFPFPCLCTHRERR